MVVVIEVAVVVAVGAVAIVEYVVDDRLEVAVGLVVDVDDEVVDVEVVIGTVVVEVVVVKVGTRLQICQKQLFPHVCVPAWLFTTQL